MKDLKKTGAECVREIEREGISVPEVRWKVTNRFTARLAQCRYESATRKPSRTGCVYNRRTRRYYYNFVIDVSSILLQDDFPAAGMKQTILHELLHACAPGDGHGYLWKEYADRINAAYGYHIQRLAGAEETAAFNRGVGEAHPWKYILKCEKCGYEVRRRRISRLVQHPEWYTHKGCGGRFERVK